MTTSLFSQITDAISKTTKPILGLFVLIILFECICHAESTSIKNKKQKQKQKNYKNNKTWILIFLKTIWPIVCALHMCAQHGYNQNKMFEK